MLASGGMREWKVICCHEKALTKLHSFSCAEMGLALSGESWLKLKDKDGTSMSIVHGNRYMGRKSDDSRKNRVQYEKRL